jgi:hypothetical protein
MIHHDTIEARLVRRLRLSESARVRFAKPQAAMALVALLIAAAPAAAQPTLGKGAGVAWKKTIVDKAFRSEGVGIADVNKDGKKDIICGDVWYEAPDWKMHVLSDQRKFPANGWSPVQTKTEIGYSESFCVFPDDFNGDGWVDVIVIPFPGKECNWYENPGKAGGFWKQHQLTNSACNETPIYVDLFGKGQKHLVMAWQPAGSKGNMGEMCYFVPGKDATQPWQRISISGPSAPGKEVPGTQRFSHGLGHGDVNGDGRIDVICTGGWWEQPPSLDGKPWPFHPANLGPLCADMYAYDVDGDGKNDIISSSAHQYGFWWHQQKSPKEFVLLELFPDPSKVAKIPAKHSLSEEELAFYNAINAGRVELKRAPWSLNGFLSNEARLAAINKKRVVNPQDSPRGYVGGVVVLDTEGNASDLVAAGKNLASGLEEKHLKPNLEIGVGVSAEGGKKRWVVLLGDRKQFSLPSQTHALHFIDINGDGQKDLVTGRRWWAHGPKGDAGPNDPAYIYWFEAQKGRDGITKFIPHEVDDDSGIGTAFVVEDIDGDGIPDIIVSNKRGVYVLVQVRRPRDAVPPKNE